MIHCFPFKFVQALGPSILFTFVVLHIIIINTVNMRGCAKYLYWRYQLKPRCSEEDKPESAPTFQTKCIHR